MFTHVDLHTHAHCEGRTTYHRYISPAFSCVTSQKDISLVNITEIYYNIDLLDVFQSCIFRQNAVYNG